MAGAIQNTARTDHIMKSAEVLTTNRKQQINKEFLLNMAFSKLAQWTLTKQVGWGPPETFLNNS